MAEGVTCRPRVWGMLAVCVIHALWFGWADIWSLIKSGGDYTPLAVSSSVSAVTYDESQLYAAGPMHFFKTGKISHEVDVPELASLPNGYPTLHVWVIGGMARLVGSIERAWMLSHTLFPCLTWFCLLVLYQRQGAADLLATALATLSVWLPMAPRNALLLGRDAWIQPLEITRTPHPSLSLSLLLALIVVLTYWLKTGGWRGGLLSALLLGSLFYAYYFMWLSACMAIGVIGLMLLVTKQWAMLGRLLGMSTLGVAIAIPYLSRAVAGIPATTTLGGALPLMRRVGSFDHEIHPVALVTGVALLIGIVVAYQRWRTQRQNYTLWLFGSLVVAGFFGMNLQVATGYDAQHDHFVNRVIQPFGFCVLMTLSLICGRRHLKAVSARKGAFGILLFTLAMGFTRQTVVAGRVLEHHRLSAERYLTLTWIRDHTDIEAVVGTLDEQLLTLLPSVAGTWNFVPLGDRSMASNEEILLRYGSVAKLIGLSLDDVLARLSADLGGPMNSASTGYVLGMQRPVAQVSLNWMKQHYATLDPQKVLTSRRLDFLIVSAADVAKMSKHPFKQVWAGTGWTVFSCQR